MKKRMTTLVLALAALLTACGGQAGSNTADSVADALTDSGYTIERQQADASFFKGSGTRLILNGDPDCAVTVYVYDSAAAAQDDAACISPDGFSINRPGEGVCIEWVSTPHFYLWDNLLVQYVGTDEELLALLEQTCGAPVAGGK